MNSEVGQFIPERYIECIRACHRAGLLEMQRRGLPLNEAEAVEVAEMVEAHRWAWKPPKVKLVLIAESHVFTSPSDLSARYSLQGINAPNSYVRLIYCLGYGEKCLTPSLKGGTPQFWSIFGDLVGTVNTNQIGGKIASRLESKLNTLRLLQDHGVWLLDSSLHGIYRGKDGRVDADTTRSLQRLWWSHYGQPLMDELNPEKVVAIGKGVHQTLASDAGIHFSDWIYQPQGARNPDQRKRNRDALKNLQEWLVNGAAS